MADNGLTYATLDHERMTRTGFPEVIFCPGKTDSQIASIAAAIAQRSPLMLATRASESAFRAVQTQLPGIQTQLATVVSGAQTAVASTTATR